MRHTYTKKPFVVYMPFEFSQALWMLCGTPTLQDLLERKCHSCHFLFQFSVYIFKIVNPNFHRLAGL